MVYVPSDPTQLNRVKKSKYRNVKCAAMGKKFDSGGERNRYFYLQDAERRGQISNLRCQVKFDLGVCSYVADFVYDVFQDFDDYGPQRWIHVVEDFKGGYKKMAVFAIKEKLMLENHGIRIHIVKEPTAPIG